MKFIVVSLLILPILPNQGFGPFEVFNPYIIWLMVVLISGISFISYIAIKVVGTRRGIGLTGFLAGLISSTAVTMSFSEQSKANKRIINPYIFGVVVASTAVFFRILFEIFVLNKELFALTLIPLLSMGIVGSIGSFYYWRKGPDVKGRKKVSETPLKLKSPFQLSPALKFGALFAVVLFLSKISLIYLGTGGVYITSFISGVADMDAITVSLANLSKAGELDLETATNGIILASIVNLMFKGGFFYVMGNRVVGRSVLKVFGLIILSGIIVSSGMIFF